MVTAVACAATGKGSTLVTDLLAMDNENRPRLVEAGGSDLARGCLDALHLIGGTIDRVVFQPHSPWPWYS